MVDRSDIGTVVDAMYACISGPAGPRDWATQREIFHPDSRQARTRPEDVQPERRGINSIQLCRGPDGLWSILHMIWDNERPGLTASA